ncbi:MAG: 50S ribosomal protein L29 [Candidatus Harrisonbacteria bacterium CG10_big_fil_rev_8_21_14_0_10_45_28]|uniref:Large ribosomal subunit protein uL29 n=1 Tax=Candidatus Harrisonbacteria bacterium CG10_big_fil_rev_8_21_14_0_10_45_28 TaxID=1974586 RepID=A0A2H0UP11_9BACT|nr:MAG: 50S ribosomal protein L29 [Candidatus Harrisonbacteria bacterium CG10_big_fil_rev_8_21_14_0_10_45_28]
MKRKDLEKIKGLAVVDLHKDLKEKREKLWKLRGDIAVGKNKNVREANTLRKDIARVKTLLTSKQEENK